MSIMDYNGGSVVAMVGKECVAIACDLRLGNQALIVASDFEKVCMCIRPITVYMLVECRQVDQRDRQIGWTG
jgi:20S proteasome alpha/beta subunit